MAKDYSIQINLGSTMDILGTINKEVFPYLHQAVNAVGNKVAQKWKKEVLESDLWSGEKDKYAKSISWQMTGDFSGYVEATYKWAEEIESGRPERDLKKMLNTSLKVRRTKSGKRFLVIPFRHNVKDMPDELYAQAKALEASKVTGQTQRRSGEITFLSRKTGMQPAKRQTPFLTNVKTHGPMMVNQSQYKWGGRIHAGYFGPNPKGKVDHAAGMVRFDTSSGKQKSSDYMTFRIMMEGQQGWVVKPQPGKWIARKVRDDMAPKAAEAFKATMGWTLKVK
ncbi:hypothetical protein ECML606-1_000030 [Escherichia phage ECML-606-1]|nr:hypothetical protein ECML606-1_000030 [Escherichia phage ECML-606-1]